LLQEKVQATTGKMFPILAIQEVGLDGCIPASGWKKGQVENQVDLAVTRFFGW
jgi:hypothetical protein